MQTAELGERERHIIDLVRRQGHTGIDALARRFEVTPQTIRRCVNSLCEQGHLRRVHGGVDLPALHANLPYKRRQVQHLQAKQRIAAAVAAFVPDGSSLSIGLGTTPEQVALALREHQDLRVITNSLNVANALAGCAGITLTLAGGTLRPSDLDIVGPAAAQCFAGYKTDFAVFGVGGIDEDGSLLDFEPDEVLARQAMAEHTRTRVLVADASKFGRNALARGGRIEAVHHFFTDQAPPPACASWWGADKVALHVAGEH
ncbi:MAG: DeoR/GlpR family DNA-binding transcription regulator [Giesbergeria sp.]